MEEQDRKLSEDLVSSGLISQNDANQSLEEVIALQSKGEQITLGEHLQNKKLLPPDFIFFPIIENISQMEVLDKNPPHRQFSGIRKEKTLWIFMAEMTSHEYEVVRQRVNIIRDCPSTLLINPKGFGKLYPWRGYMIRNIPQGLSLNKFLATDPAPDEIQSVANFLLQGMAELENYFIPVPPCPAWVYVDIGLVQIAGQEGGPFMGEFPKEYQAPEGECTLPMNVYPLGKILLRLYFQTTEITPDFLQSTFPRDLVLRKMLHPNPQHRYARFSEAWNDWQKVQLGMPVPSLEALRKLPFEAPPLEVLSATTPINAPHSAEKKHSSRRARSSSSLKKTLTSSANRPSIRRRKKPMVAPLIFSALLMFAIILVVTWAQKQGKLGSTSQNSNTNTPQNTSSGNQTEFVAALQEADALAKRHPLKFEENIERYQRIRSKWVKTEHEATLIRERISDVKAEMSVFRSEEIEQLKSEINRLVIQKNWNDALAKVSSYETQYQIDDWSETAKRDLRHRIAQAEKEAQNPTPENTDPENETKTTPENTDPVEKDPTPPENESVFEKKDPDSETSETVPSFDQIRDEMWRLVAQGKFVEFQQMLQTLLKKQYDSEAAYYSMRAEGLIQMRQSALETLLQSKKEVTLTLKGQKYKGSLKTQDHQLSIQLSSGGSFPFALEEMDVGELAAFGNFVSVDDEVFLWLALEQLEKAQKVSSGLSEESYLKPILADQVQESSSSNDREKAQQRWKRIQQMWKQRQYKSCKKLYDQSLSLLAPLFPEEEAEILSFHTELLKQLGGPAEILAAHLRVLDPKKIDLQYRFTSEEELSDFSCLSRKAEIEYRKLYFQGSLFYTKVAFQTLDLQLKATTPLAIHFGKFQIACDLEQAGNFPIPDGLENTLLTLRFQGKQCTLLANEKTIGTLPWDGKSGAISFHTEETAVLHFLGLKGDQLPDLEKLYQSFSKWNKESYPLQSGVRFKLYEDFEFFRLKAEGVRPTLNFIFDKTPFPNNSEENFSVRWYTHLYFPEAGERTFYLDSDEGVRFFVFGDLRLNTRGLPSPEGMDETQLKELDQKKKITISLRKGFIPIFIEQINEKKGGFLFVCLEDKDGKKLPLPLLFARTTSQ